MNAYLHCLSHTPLVGYVDPEQAVLDEVNGTIADARARLARIEPLIQESMRCQDGSHADPGVACHVSNESMRLACRPGKTKRPDYIVLPYRQPQHPLGSWSIIDPEGQTPAITFWIYGCAEIMADLDHAAAVTFVEH